MAKKDRTGNRKTRDQRKQFKVPELGYCLIVTDTEATERCFFTGLHQALPEDVRNKLVIKVVETKTRREPYSKHLDDGIFELRCKFGSDITRVLYFFYYEGKIILTNGFVKKTQKTPKGMKKHG